MEDRAGAAALVISPHAVVADRTAAWIWGVDCFSFRELDVVPPLETRTLRGHRAPRGQASGPANATSKPNDWVCGRRRARDHSAAHGARPGLRPSPARRPGRDGRPGARPRAHVQRARARRAQVLPAPRRRPAARAGRTGRRHARSRRASRGRGSRCTTRVFHGRRSTGGSTTDGVPKYRLDLAYPHAKVAIEYDGEEFHTSEEDKQADAERRAWLERHGWTVIVVDKNSFTDEAIAHLERGDPYRTRRRPTAAAALVRAVVAVTTRNSTHHEHATQRITRRNSTHHEAQLDGLGEGGAHGGEGGGEAGELLELEGGLVDEEVEARDQYLVPAGPGQLRCRAPTGRAGWATGGRRPRRRPGRPRTARPRRRSGRRPGWWRRRPRRPPRRRAATAPPRRARPGAGRARPRRPRPATGSRTSSRIVPAPRSARARPVDVAVAPPPRTVATLTGPVHTRPDRRRRPGDVGVVGVPPAVRVHEGVGHPRSYHRRRHLISTLGRLPLQRRGDRQPPPRRVEAVHERREPAGRHPVRVVLPVQATRVVRRPVQQRRQRVRDRVAQHPTDHGISSCRTGSRSTPAARP